MNNNGKKTSLKVIPGGLSIPFSDREKEFDWAYVTDTRLMGVVGLCVAWKIPGPSAEYYQLFYFDAEEFGLDTYKGISAGLNSDNMAKFYDEEAAMMGGLGGQKIQVSLSEVQTLVSEFVAYNKEHDIKLPGPVEDYLFLASDESAPVGEGDLVMSKICEPITSIFQLVNYFVMRVFGKDEKAANYLAKGFKVCDYYPDIQCATLCKNTIDPVPGQSNKYLCESVLDSDDGFHYIVTSQVEIDADKVIGFEPIDKFKISPIEAALKLSRPEYITVLKYQGNFHDFDRHTTNLTLNSMITEHKSGTVYMIFNPDNRHVNRKVFQLNGDVYGVYYVNTAGEILISSYSEENLSFIEKDLGRSRLPKQCIVHSRYSFNAPVFFKYIESEIPSFLDFLDILKMNN